MKRSRSLRLHRRLSDNSSDFLVFITHLIMMYNISVAIPVHEDDRHLDCIECKHDIFLGYSNLSAISTVGSLNTITNHAGVAFMPYRERLTRINYCPQISSQSHHWSSEHKSKLHQSWSNDRLLSSVHSRSNKSSAFHCWMKTVWSLSTSLKLPLIYCSLASSSPSLILARSSSFPLLSKAELRCVYPHNSTLFPAICESPVLFLIKEFTICRQSMWFTENKKFYSLTSSRILYTSSSFYFFLTLFHSFCFWLPPNGKMQILRFLLLPHRSNCRKS